MEQFIMFGSWVLPGRKVMTNLDSVLKSRDITLPTKVCLIKVMVFPLVMCGCESWTIKKAEHQKIDAFGLWCWRRLFRVPWTARRSNQSILKEINLGIHMPVLCWSAAAATSLQSCPTLCDPMNCNTPGLPVHHQLPEFTQIHVHRVSEAIQPSHPVVPFSSCPQSLPASESFPMSQLFA